jgi:hypothetical protein
MSNLLDRHELFLLNHGLYVNKILAMHHFRIIQYVWLCADYCHQCLFAFSPLKIRDWNLDLFFPWILWNRSFNWAYLYSVFITKYFHFPFDYFPNFYAVLLQISLPRINKEKLIVIKWSKLAKSDQIRFKKIGNSDKLSIFHFGWNWNND